jgi:lipid II:glycine glycyltransferase (peptidoglycan interpeptide bridge formation enzyme)
MYDLLATGRAQLALARIGDRPVAATYLMRFGRLALYASGAYVRDLGKFPVSHWPLYASMLAAKQSGIDRLVLGTVFHATSSGSLPKERSIAAFKLGFATRVVARRSYDIES